MAGSRRQQIVDAIVIILKEIDGTSPNLSNLYENVEPVLIFYDEVNDFPTVSVVSGNETREYLPGDFKWAFLNVNVRIYVNEEDPKTALENIFYDIEVKIDENNTLNVDGSDRCTDIRLLSISDDEGLLAPLGVGEMVFQVQYQV
jgi:hypothetical protein